MPLEFFTFAPIWSKITLAEGSFCANVDKQTKNARKMKGILIKANCLNVGVLTKIKNGFLSV
jgi:hypothetical protein